MIIESGRLLDKWNFSIVRSTLPYNEFAFMIRGSELDFIGSESYGSFGFSLVNYAIACSPAPAEAEHQLTSLIITSDGPLYFHQTKLDSGTVLNSYFNNQYGKSIGELIDQNELFQYDDELYFFQLAQQPDSTIHQSFNFELEFDDGITFILQTDSVMIR